jgi:meiosis arrest female protein 1
LTQFVLNNYVIYQKEFLYQIKMNLMMLIVIVTHYITLCSSFYCLFIDKSGSELNLSLSQGSFIDSDDSDIDELQFNDGLTPPSSTDLTPPTFSQGTPTTRRYRHLSSMYDSDEELINIETSSSSDDEGDNDIQSSAPLMSIQMKHVNGDHDDSADNNSDDEGRPSPTPLKEPPRTVATAIPLEPVGLFWDIENCPVPVTKSAFAFANKMKVEFFTGKREAEFMCVCDTLKERREVIDELQKAHVTIVHVNATAKNAADDKLRQSLRKFANTYHHPATVVLVSGDVNFSPELNDLRHVHNITVILVHNSQASEALKVCAHKTVLFDQLIADVPPPKHTSGPVPTVLFVRGLPNGDANKIKNQLSRLADNCGGKIIEVKPSAGTAKVLFRNEESARR